MWDNLGSCAAGNLPSVPRDIVFNFPFCLPFRKGSLTLRLPTLLPGCISFRLWLFKPRCQSNVMKDLRHLMQDGAPSVPGAPRVGPVPPCENRLPGLGTLPVPRAPDSDFERKAVGLYLWSRRTLEISSHRWLPWDREEGRKMMYTPRGRKSKNKTPTSPDLPSSPGAFAPTPKVRPCRDSPERPACRIHRGLALSFSHAKEHYERELTFSLSREEVKFKIYHFLTSWAPIFAQSHQFLFHRREGSS